MSNVKKDCFAYKQVKKIPDCRILKELCCKNEECKFYQSKYDVDVRKIEQDIKAYSKRENTKGAN